MRTIDLNSDLGEGAGVDVEVMALITSANIACGGHAGDEATMDTAVHLALEHGVAIGAHPGYPDRENFGRVALEMALDALGVEIRSQVERLKVIAERAGGRVTHVKAHGALYNGAERDEGLAATIARALSQTDLRLAVFAPPTSAMALAAEQAGLRVAREGFIDRAYEPDGTLRSRKLAGALITDPAVAAAQALSFIRDGGVPAHDGSFLKLDVDTLCVHGDTPGAPAILRAVRSALEMAGVGLRPLA